MEILRGNLKWKLRRPKRLLYWITLSLTVRLRNHILYRAQRLFVLYISLHLCSAPLTAIRSCPHRSITSDKARVLHCVHPSAELERNGEVVVVGVGVGVGMVLAVQLENCSLS